MLLDDSLHRLTDVKTLQQAMESPEWMNQPIDMREKRERYFHGQERSARAFMALANAILDFLLSLSRYLSEPFIRSPGMVQKVVSMLLWFLRRLCGPQMSSLAVKNPEKYGYNPKELLGKIVSIGTSFATSSLFVDTMARDMDYSADLMSKTYSIVVNRKILPSYESTKFRSFFENVNMIVTQNTQAEENLITMIDINENPTISEDEAEQLYKDNLAELMFDAVEMKQPDSTYIHHYNDNILNNTGNISKQKNATT